MITISAGDAVPGSNRYRVFSGGEFEPEALVFCEDINNPGYPSAQFQAYYIFAGEVWANREDI